MYLLTAFCLILSLFCWKAEASEWHCFVTNPTKDAAPPQFCYNAETVTRDSRRNLIGVWVKRVDGEREETSQIEIGCYARMFRVVEAPKDFWDHLSGKEKGASTVGNWLEIVPDSEVDAVRKAVCNPASTTNPSPRR
jgi:hypothetical protein